MSAVAIQQPERTMDMERTTMTTFARSRVLLTAAVAALAAVSIAVAIAATPAEAAFGDNFGIATAEGPALPGPSSFWAGTCDLSVAPGKGEPIPGGVGSTPTEVIVNPGFPPIIPPTFGPGPEVPGQCIDAGIGNPGFASPAPWTTPPSWRQAPLAQAGAHPDATTTFAFNRAVGLPGQQVAWPEGNVKTVRVDLPAGFVGNPTVASQCSGADFGQVPPRCPPSSQVGILATTFLPGIFAETLNPVYNLKPRRGKTAEFGIAVGELTTLKIVAEAVPSAAGGDGGYRLRTVIGNIPAQGPILANTLTLWGVPYAASHDLWRMPQGLAQIPRNGLAPSEQQLYQPSWGPIKPLITNPSRCTPDAPVTELSVDSWQQPGTLKSYGATAEKAIEGCDQVPFVPTITATPETTKAATPTGLSVDLDVPQQELPNQLGTSPLKDSVVKLPAGMTVSPAAADGLSGCSDAQIGIGNASPPSCPESSKIGTVLVKTPLLEDPVPGTIYLGTQTPTQLVRLFLVLDDPDRGLLVKIAGKVDPDPSSGQLTAIFENNPQLPFSNLHLEFKGGPRATLVTPNACGTYTTEAQLTPWSAPGGPVRVSDSFTIDEGCGKQDQFTPGFEAGTTNPVGGKPSPFSLRVTREDGQQNVAAIGVTLPEGLTAKLAGVPLCGDAEAASGDCPAASQVGATTVGVGAGPNPLYVPQPGKAPTGVYLAGPYKGAPYSLVVKVPAQAGPFDLGNVAVRSAIDVDPTTAQVSVKSDPLPQILQGIPIAYRDIRVDVNRDDFTLNPTSCAAMSVGGQISSAQGAGASVASRFQTADCASLGFAPKLALSLKGGVRRGAYPKLKAVLTQPAGQANIGSVSVALPHSEFLAQNHIRTICTRVQFSADQCPKGSVYGKAKAWTPLLDRPLEGPVYLRSSSHKLPDLVAALHGQVDIDLAGRIDSKNGGIRNTFETVPDAPVSRFVLEMQGGKKGLLQNSTNICKSANKATIHTDGHNGKLHDTTPVLSAQCGKKKPRS